MADLLGYYMDDSRDAEQRKMICVAGLFQHGVNWFEVERKWEMALRKANIKYFRAVECENLRGEFEQFRDRTRWPKPLGKQESIRIRDELIDIAKSGHLVGAAVTVLVKDFEEIWSKYGPTFGKQMMECPATYGYHILMTQTA